jgi:hypothetical protein
MLMISIAATDSSVAPLLSSTTIATITNQLITPSAAAQPQQQQLTQPLQLVVYYFTNLFNPTTFP